MDHCLTWHQVAENNWRATHGGVILHICSHERGWSGMIHDVTGTMANLETSVPLLVDDAIGMLETLYAKVLPYAVHQLHEAEHGE